MENTGNTTLKFLEVFASGTCLWKTLSRFFLILQTLLGLFQDISLAQWLALTPPSLVKAHLGFSDKMIARLSRNKLEVV